MEVRAYLKGAKLSPQKACLIADMVRGLDVEKALDLLSFSKQKGASLVKKLLDSAISNAENNENADIDNLKIKSIIVNKGLVMKRIKIRARGRADRITKPMCCLLYTSPSPRDKRQSRMPSSA